MKLVASSVIFCLLGAGAAQAADSITAGATRTFAKPSLGLTVVATEIELPAGTWEVAAVTPASVLEQVFVSALTPGDDIPRGRRVALIERDRRVEATRNRLHTIYPAIREHASARGGRGPRVFADLDAKKWSYALRDLDAFFLVPEVVLPPAPGRRSPNDPVVPLVLEVRPLVDDGRHWVLFADGRVERRPIDPALIAQHSLVVTPAAAPIAPDPERSVRHLLLGLQRAAGAAAVSVAVVERTTAARRDVRWSLAGAQPGTPDLLARWAEARARGWRPLLQSGHAPILHAWLARSRELYGVSMAPGDGGTPRDAPRTTDAFHVLGGRAAVRETLQLQLIRAGAPAAAEREVVPLSTIRGVQVKSHPFDQMLQGKPGGRVGLADLVPPDRFFVHVAKPAAVYPLLDAGGDFLFRAGSLFTRSAVDDDVKGRYLRRLGLEDRVARQFLDSGEVTELALVASDLFFLDGTDVTVLMRARAPQSLALRMRLVGLPDPSTTGITEKALGGGRSAFWARRGTVVAVSTSRAELDGVLALHAAQGAGSLGRSPEFRYMLAQVPPGTDTRAVVYFSDPFIRRMVGPAVKIAQLRRMRARAEMEMITAGALLYVLDGHRDKPALDALIRLGYVPASVAAGGYRLRDDLSVVSPVWGPAADLVALGAVPIDSVTPSEAQAYQRYVDEYSQYWRQYFDPIVMRLDDGPDGALELSTFILPLVDSALYAGVREFLAPRESGVALRVPVVGPDPVLLLSLNLTDQAWVKLSGSWSQMFSTYTGIHPALFDHLGPGLHVAIQDGDPIIALGNADLLGGFAGPMLTANVMREGWPLLLSLLTRPCKILVQLQDEAAVLQILRKASRGVPETRRAGTQVEFRQVEGRDAWIYTLGIAGVVKVRFGIEVRNGYLVLSNIPWSQPVAIASVEGRAFNGADLQIAPGAVRHGLPGLFATQSEQQQLAAVHGMAALYPLLMTVSPAPADATARHAALFGARPLHPGPGGWTWKDGTIASTVYGTAAHPTTPLYRPETGDFGLFEGVTRLSVNMQFEADGLRALVRWVWTGR